MELSLAKSKKLLSKLGLKDKVKRSTIGGAWPPIVAQALVVTRPSDSIPDPPNDGDITNDV